LRRYGHSKLSKMAEAAILNLFESKIAPLDPPSPYNQTWSGSDDRLRRYGHLKFFQDGGRRHLGFVRTGNSAIRSAVPENSHPRTKHELDQTTGCGDIATWNFSNMGAAAILDLFELEIAQLDPPSPKTPTLEQNMKWIGRPVAEISPLEIFPTWRWPPSWICSNRK